jgi:RimJ/RimL family protein N-acetyltransferase
MGYTIFERWRRKGFAFEMINAFMAHARAQDVRWVLLSVSPENQPSLALAKKLGAEHIGSHIDEKDGPEDIFLIEL